MYTIWSLVYLFIFSTCTCRFPWLHVIHVQKNIRITRIPLNALTRQFLLRCRKMSRTLITDLDLKAQELEVKQRDVTTGWPETMRSMSSLKTGVWCKKCFMGFLYFNATLTPRPHTRVRAPISPRGICYEETGTVIDISHSLY